MSRTAGRCRLEPRQLVAADPRRMAIAPGAFHQHAACRRLPVPGSSARGKLGDRAAPILFAGGMLTRHHTQPGHQLARRAEPCQIADLRQLCRGKTRDSPRRNTDLRLNTRIRDGSPTSQRFAPALARSSLLENPTLASWNGERLCCCLTRGMRAISIPLRIRWRLPRRRGPGGQPDALAFGGCLLSPRRYPPAQECRAHRICAGAAATRAAVAVYPSLPAYLSRISQGSSPNFARQSL